MFNIKKDLAPGEQLVYTGKLSLWPRTLEILLGILLIPLVIGVFILAKIALSQISTSYAITSRRFIASSGILSKKTESMPHSRAMGSVIHQTFWGRLFNYGTISIICPLGNSDGTFKNFVISNPTRFDIFYRRVTTPKPSVKPAHQTPTARRMTPQS